MKVTEVDQRHVQTHVEIRDGVRTETVKWGDVRDVSIGLEMGEVPDVLSGGGRGKRTLFRPQHAHIEWKRNLHWTTAHGVGQFVHNRAKPATEGWVLTNASIRGTNIRADGSTGKLGESLLFANDDGWGIGEVLAQPDWYATLFNEHDPNRTGSALDDEPMPGPSDA